MTDRPQPPSRRRFVAGSLAGSLGAAIACTKDGAGSAAGADASPRTAVLPTTVIDTHTHFYDPKRSAPPGRDRPIPWPRAHDLELYRTVLPADWERLARPLGITGTIVVEAGTPWLEVNDWILGLAQTHRSIVGLVGNLSGDDVQGEVRGPVWGDFARFTAELTRLARNPLFLGIRVGSAQVQRGLGAEQNRFDALADANLVLDVNGVGAEDIAALAAAVPSLRIVVDHMLSVNPLMPDPTWVPAIAALAARPNVFLKVSALVEGTGAVNGSAPSDPARYRTVLDQVWRSFGADRLIFGTNWPVSERNASLAVVHRIVASYFADKGQGAAGKFFAANAKRVYRYVDR